MDFITAVIFVLLVDAQIVPSLANWSLFGLTPDSFDMTLIVFGNFLTFWSGQMFQAHLVHLLPQVWNQPFLQEALVPFIPSKDLNLSFCIPENHHFPGQ